MDTKKRVDYMLERLKEEEIFPMLNAIADKEENNDRFLVWLQMTMMRIGDKTGRYLKIAEVDKFTCSLEVIKDESNRAADD